MSTIPGYEGAVGPFPGQYGALHVYARSVHSGAGNCVCGGGLYDARHVQAAPGVPLPDRPQPIDLSWVTTEPGDGRGSKWSWVTIPAVLGAVVAVVAILVGLVR